MHTHKEKNTGFTIIETMIAVALFLVVIMAGMDSLLNANVIHQKSQDMRSVLDGLTFMTEDISKNLRTGYNIHCIDDGNFNEEALAVPKSCANGGAIAFEHALGNPADPSDQWVYKVEAVGSGPFVVSKSIDSASTWVRLSNSELLMNSFSGFSVLGAEPAVSGNTQQPFSIIRLSGRILLKNGSLTPFSLQTAVSQRIVDL